jgi:hypothetical protein
MSKRISDPSHVTQSVPKKGFFVPLDPDAGNTEKFDLSDIMGWIAPRLPAAGLHITYGGGSAACFVPAGPKFIRLGFVMPVAASGFTFATVARLDPGSITTGALALGDSDSSANLTLRVFGATSGDYRQLTLTGIKTAYGAQAVALTLVSNGTTRPTVYVNGAEWTSFGTEATTGDAPADWSGFESLVATRLAIAGNNSFRGVLYFAEVGNVALTAAEVLALRYGWGALSHYLHTTGAGRTLISPSLLNGGFETMGSGGNYVFDRWRNASNITVTAETTDVYAGSQSLKLVGGGGLNITSGNWLACTPNNTNTPFGSPYEFGKAFKRRFAAKHLAGGNLQTGTGFTNRRTVTPGEAASWTVFEFSYVVSTSSITTGNAVSPTFGAASGAEWLLDDVTEVSIGLCGRWVFDRNSGYCVRDLSGAKNPLILDEAVPPPGPAILAEGADIIAVPIPVMFADAFIHGDRLIVPAGYEPYAATLIRESGASTGTITIRRTSSGGTTLFTGTLGASVALTPTIVPFTTADKLHLTNSDWASSSVRGVVWCRRIN